MTEVRFPLKGLQMTCRPFFYNGPTSAKCPQIVSLTLVQILKLCFGQYFDVNVVMVVDLVYAPIYRVRSAVNKVIYSIECIYCHLCRTSGKYQNLVIG